MNVTNFNLFISQILSSQNITTNETTYYLQKNGSILYSPTQGLKVLNIASHLQMIKMKSYMKHVFQRIHFIFLMQKIMRLLHM